jgi:hypothetical protein
MVDDREQICLKSIMKGACFADVVAIQEHLPAVLRSIPKEAFTDSFQKLYDIANSVLLRMVIILKANKVNLFVSSVLFVSWYLSPNFLDTPRKLLLCLTHPTNVS